MGRVAGDVATGARGLPCRRPSTSRRSTAACSRRRRTPLVERRRMPDAPRRERSCWRWRPPSRAGRQRIAYPRSGRRTAGCGLRARARIRARPTTARLSLASHVDRAQGDRQLLHARAITEFLVRRTLGPLVRRPPGRGDPRAARRRSGDGQRRLPRGGLPLSRRARRAGAGGARASAGHGDIAVADGRDSARTVAERCLFGVDLNPTAVQLARLSLWLTTLAADRPLTFLDHHLAVGDSLIGARLSDLARLATVAVRERRARPRRLRCSMFEAAVAGVLATPCCPSACDWRWRHPTRSTRSSGKERRLAALTAPEVRSPAGRAPPTCGAPAARGPSRRRRPLCRRVAAARWARRRRCRQGVEAMDGARAAAGAGDHGACPLGAVFPEVFLRRGRHGPGRCRLRCGDWQSAVGDAARGHRRRRSRRGARADARALMRFIRRSGHLPLQGTGSRIEYQLFASARCRRLRPGGRIGLIVPSGIGRPTRQRRACAAAGRYVRHRHVAGIRQPPGDLPDSSRACGSWCCARQSGRDRAGHSVASGLADVDVLDRYAGRRGGGSATAFRLRGRGELEPGIPST